jgi:hypothetical protein
VARLILTSLCENAFLKKLLRIVFSGRAISKNIASGLVGEELVGFGEDRVGALIAQRPQLLIFVQSGIWQPWMAWSRLTTA